MILRFKHHYKSWYYEVDSDNIKEFFSWPVHSDNTLIVLHHQILDPENFYEIAIEVRKPLEEVTKIIEEAKFNDDFGGEVKMKYPPFPFEHIYHKSTIYLDINKPFQHTGHAEFPKFLLQGFFKRHLDSQIKDDVTWTLLSPEEFQKAVDDFKENYDFNNQFEEKLK